jgi:O-antigen ligase/tetratricopeptide (TPR) repeat protein
MNLKTIVRSISISAIFLIPFFAILAPSGAAHPIFPSNLINDLFFPFITGKAFYFRILTEIAFAGWIILAFLDPKYRPKCTPVSITITIFAFVVLLSDLLGVNPIRSMWSNFERMEGWVTIIHLWALFMAMVNVFGTGESGRRMWQRYMNTHLVVAGIVAIYAFVQLLGGAQIHQGSRIDASLGNAAYLAVYMLFQTFISAYMFFVAKNKKISGSEILVWVYGISFFVFGYLLVETATRGTILGLIGGVLLALALYAIFGGKKKEDKKWRWISLGIIVFIMVVGILFWVNRDAKFIQNHEALRRMASISISENKTQARAYIWPAAVKGAMERPLFGWGQDNFNYIFNSNYNPKMWAQEQWFDRAHSVFLDWLVSSGLVGIIVYLALYVMAIIVIWKSTFSVAEKSTLTGLIVGYAIHNIFVFDNLASYILFFSFLGFVSSNYQNGKDTNTKGLREFKNETVEYVVAPLVLVLLIVTIYMVNVRVIQANTTLIKALVTCQSGKTDSTPVFEKALSYDMYVANQEIREQLITCAQNTILSNATSGPMKQSIFLLTDAQIQKQIEATPKDARIYNLAGNLMNSIQNGEKALEYLKIANELFPNKPAILISLAEAYLRTNNKDKAIETIKAAYELSTDNYNARDAYARALVIMGREKEAIDRFKANPEIFDTQGFAQLYVSLKQYDKAIDIAKKLINSDPKKIEYKVMLADIQNAAGYKWEAVQTLKGIANDFPEYKTQVDQAIKQIQK